MTRITKIAPLFEGFVQEKEYSSLLENINESVDTEIVEKYKTLSTEKQAAEAINELIDKKVSLEEFFATMSELKQGFKPKSGTELSEELTKALNRMTDTYKLLSEKNREIGKRIVEKIKGKPKASKSAPAKKVNESRLYESSTFEGKEELVKGIFDSLKDLNVKSTPACKNTTETYDETQLSIISSFLESLLTIDDDSGYKKENDALAKAIVNQIHYCFDDVDDSEKSKFGSKEDYKPEGCKIKTKDFAIALNTALHVAGYLVDQLCDDKLDYFELDDLVDLYNGKIHDGIACDDVHGSICTDHGVWYEEELDDFMQSIESNRVVWKK